MGCKIRRRSQDSRRPAGTFWPLVRACWTIPTRSPFVSPLLRRNCAPQYAWTQKLEVRPSTRDIDDALDAWLSSPSLCSPAHLHLGARTGRRHQLGRPGSLHGTSIERHQLLRQPRTCSATSRPSGDQPRRALLDTAQLGQPAAVERPDSNVTRAWISGFDRIIVSKELTQLRNAALHFRRDR